ncbi:RHS repeat-associated core domain-containing protein [Streptomyces sp. NPDC006798]|uniref:RHS repeat-associated core domain-containing protein n=1 Tax=Streptomyces sp. NPDC006798 TaxID=3155462 RepID=UPI00340F2B09
MPFIRPDRPPRSRRGLKRRRTATVAVPVVLALTATLIAASPAPEDPFTRDHTALVKPDYGKAEPFKAKHRQVTDPTVAAAEKTRALAAAPVAWPVAGTAEHTIPAPATTVAKTNTKSGSQVKAATGPVSLAPARTDAKARSAKTAAPATPAKATVKILDRAATDRLGIQGVVLTVQRADGKPDPSALSVGVDYRGFAHAYGGNWSSRLRMVQLPACALTTPNKPACRTTKPVPSTNDSTAQTVTAQVTTPKAATGARSTPAVLALSAGAASDRGTYEATALSPSATWSGGGSTGGFSWSYPLATVPAPAGPAPALSIGYSSQSVDGRTSATSAQPSWIGEGFDLPTSYIERSYASCDDDGQKDKYDLCWKEENASIVLNGKSSTLVKDKTSGVWRLQGDDGERVTRGLGAPNGDEGDTGASGDTGEHWTVTTTDGTQYVFGKNQLPGWSTGKPETNSVWTVPVYGDDSGEPGYGSGTSFAGRAKKQAWRWNLDYVVDPNGNVMSYWYAKEFNSYAQNGTTGNGTEYVRGGHLQRIDYGQRTDTVFSTTQPAAARVKFDVMERCVPVSGKETCTNLTATNRAAWPDVPFDQICQKNTVCTDKPSPSFFSRKKLKTVTTQVYKGTGTGVEADYRSVNAWALDSNFPSPGDGSSPGLWLKSIQHTGMSGTPITLPSVGFSGIQLHNRVDKTGDDVPPFIKWRVRAVTSETGSVLNVNYSGQDCLAGVNVPALDKNTRRCYPVKWIPPSNPTPGTDPQPRTDWFHKYVVNQVTESDPAGGAPLKQTDYTYHDGAAWAYDDQSPITPAKYRTWGIWRGYQKVTTTTGEAAGIRSKSTGLFYRGMHGDKQLDNTTRTATVTDSQGTAVTDAEQYAGQVREEITYNGTAGPEISGTITTPWSRTSATATPDYGTVNAYMTRTAQSVQRTPVPGGGHITSVSKTTYDHASGLPLTVETEGGGQKDCTRTEYVVNTTAWILNLPKRVEKVSVGCDATPNRTGDPQTTDVLSDNRISYDGQAYGVAPTKGNATKAERVTGYAAGVPEVQTVGTAKADALGRATEAFDANGTRTVHVEYTPATGGPLTGKTETNALGHTITTEVIPDWGVNKAHIDPNGGRTESNYDALGRVTDIWLADRNREAGQTPNNKFEYQVQRGAASWVASKSLNNDGTTYRTSYAIFDSLLRPRQTQVPAAVGSGRVVAETLYDSRGLEVQTTADYIDTTAPSGRLANLLTTAPAGSRTVYDGGGRPTTQIALVQEQEHSRTTTTYEGNSTTVEPPAGASAVRETTDSRGRIAEKREYDGNTATGHFTKLTYAYDHADRLTQVKDNDNNTWSYSYDFLGRKTQARDPDAGTNKSEYDNLDRVSVTEDARGTILSHTYDAIGRPTGELTGRIPVVNGQPVIDDSKYLSRWSYDTIAKGKLTSSIRYDGGKNGKVYATTNASYDKLYRVLREQHTVSTAEGALAGATGIYTITNAYNNDGTLQRRTIPAMGGLDQETLVYGYNAQRMPDTLQGLTGIVQSTAYLPAGEKIRTTLGVSSTAKWTEINRFYEDGTKRLARQTVVTESRTGTDSDVYYRYDLAGNPVEVDDRSTAQGDKQCYTYDGHRRLKSAWTATTDCATAPTTANVGGVAPYWVSYTYDSAGNRKTAVDHLATGGAATTTYNHDLTSGQTPRPHLLTGTSTTPADPTRPATSYTYDAAGNTVTRTTGTGADAKTQTLEWGPENALESVKEADNTTTSYLNDANGNRLIRRDATGTTLHVGETELRLDKATNTVEATRYYSHDGQIVAVRTPDKLTWTATDHNGTANLQVDAATQALTRRHSRPFGEDRGAAPQTWTGDKGFVGGTEDPTGLTHIGAREYDPTTGRFISADPIADLKDPQQINGYAYSNNNPVTFADPDGKFWGAFVKFYKAVVTYVTSQVHQTYRSKSSGRSSGGSSRSGGMSAQGGANYSGGSSSIGCGATYPAYKAHCTSEPVDPQSWGDAWKAIAKSGAAGIDFLLGVADAIEKGTEPQCQFGADCGLQDDYREKVKEYGIDPSSKDYQDSKNSLEIASYVTGAFGVARSLARGILGLAGKKKAVPTVKLIDGWLPESVLEKIPGHLNAPIPNKKGVGLRWLGPKQDSIRIDKGNPNNPQPFQQVHHVVINSRGVVIGRNGKPLNGAIKKNYENAYQAHIPLDEWLTWETWNSPKR